MNLIFGLLESLGIERAYTLPKIQHFIITIGFVAVICLLSYLIPGSIQKGQKLEKNLESLQYKINGLITFIASIALYILLAVYDQIDGAYLAKNNWQMLYSFFLFSVILSLYLYVKGNQKRKKLGSNKLDKNYQGFQGFIVGMQLNPRDGSLDYKFFSYRPAMTLWILNNLSYLFLQKDQFEITMRMVAYQLFCFLYVLDYFYNQKKMLSTWDIIHQNFGFMLVFGDYVFIPFVFSTAAPYIAHASELSQVYLAIAVILFIAGYFIFRLSNSQKDQFKSRKNDAGYKVLDGKLLISGWWGMARHINYFGDLLISLSMAVTCIQLHLFSFMYAIYLHLLLVHRAIRDNSKCQQKYGKTWQIYCNQVPNIIAPFKLLDMVYRVMGKIMTFGFPVQSAKSQNTSTRISSTTPSSKRL